MIYNPYPQVDLPFGKDNKYFKILFDAIMRVDKSFVTYTNKLGKNPDEQSNHIERIFAYELYRQWFNLLETEGVKSIILNAEPHKDLGEDIEYYNNTEKKTISVYPDMVLHHSQGDCSIQKMICEIKRGEKLDYEKIVADLYKLYLYLENSVFPKGKAFDYGIFILEGGTMSLLKGVLKKDSTITVMGSSVSINSFKEGAYHSSRIICVTYDGTNLEYNLLENIIEEKNND